MIIALKILAGFVMLIVGAELLVRGSSRLAALLGMTPLVIGLTVVAFGTSSPELSVSLDSVFAGKGGVAIGNAIGSNVLNVLLILGLSAAAVPLLVKPQVVFFDVPVLIGATIALLLLGMDGQLSRLDGVMMFSVLVVYILILIKIARRETKADRLAQHQQMIDDGDEAGAEELLNSNKLTASTLFINLGIAAVGLLVLAFGGDLFVGGSVDLAKIMGMSDLMIGLTIISIGTSLPELVTTMVASAKGERDMAVGNIIGSNLFNILCVLGVTSMVAPSGLAVSSDALNYHIPISLVVAIICIPIFFTDMKVSRWQAFLMLFLYILYLTFTILVEQDDPSNVELFNKFVLYVVAPIVTLLLVGSTIIGARIDRQHKEF